MHWKKNVKIQLKIRQNEEMVILEKEKLQRRILELTHKN